MGGAAAAAVGGSKWILRGVSPARHLKSQHISLVIRVSPDSQAVGHLVFMSVLESVLVLVQGANSVCVWGGWVSCEADVQTDVGGSWAHAKSVGGGMLQRV